MTLVNVETGEVASGWLASVDAAHAALAQVENVNEAAALVDLAEAAKVYARNVLHSREAQNHAAHVSLLCQRRAGELLAGMDLNGGDRRSESHAARVKLADVGVSKDDSSRWQRVAEIPVTTFDDAVDRITSTGAELTTTGLLKAVLGAHVGNNSGDNEWYTPAEYITAATVVMGSIDVDPASSAKANEIVGATTFYTADDNGLELRWKGSVWMNPPYAQPLVDLFCQRLVESYRNGDVTAAIALVNNATETAWFHTLAGPAAAMCFPRGRVRFWHPSKVSAPLQGQTVVYLGRNIKRFRAEFQRFGFTVAL